MLCCLHLESFHHGWLRRVQRPDCGLALDKVQLELAVGNRCLRRGVREPGIRTELTPHLPHDVVSDIVVLRLTEISNAGYWQRQSERPLTGKPAPSLSRVLYRLRTVLMLLEGGEEGDVCSCGCRGVLACVPAPSPPPPSPFQHETFDTCGLARGASRHFHTSRAFPNGGRPCRARMTTIMTEGR